MLDANIIYTRLIEIREDKFFSNREKLILYFNVVKELFNHIVANEKITYTEYALFHYVLKRFKVHTDLKTSIVNLRKYISKLKKNNKLYPTNSFLEQALTKIVKLISVITIVEIPVELSASIPNLVLELPTEIQETKTQTIKKLNAIISHKLSSNTIIICQNDDNKYVIIVAEHLVPLCSIAKRMATICFTELIETEPIISDLEEENELFNDSIFYKTTAKTQIILEPNFLVDVTELTDCFQIRNSNPIISILKRLYPDNITSISAFEGNIVNHFFDELLENIEIDFDTCLKNALVKNPLSLYYVAIEHNKEEDKQDIIQKYLKNNRRSWFDKYVKLRDIVSENFLKNNNTNIVEPSFISNIYGLQGRLDLMTETITNDNTKAIDIIELKSGKAPQRTLNMQLGLYEKRNYAIPLWANHYIQIVCYNMLLEHIIETNNLTKGSSTILYAHYEEPNSLRSVVEDHIHIQNEILLFRNYVVTFLREIADGNTNFIETIDAKLIEESFPMYDKNKANTFINNLKEFSDLEKAYFNLHISFIAKEMFAQKIGLYIDTSHRNNDGGFSALWLNSIEEKQLSGSIINDLILDIENSDFEKMHLIFNRNISNNETNNNFSNNIHRTAFREGDICIMYPV